MRVGFSRLLWPPLPRRSEATPLPERGTGGITPELTGAPTTLKMRSLLLARPVGRLVRRRFGGQRGSRILSPSPFS